jgi:integrase/recombinase XerD
MKTRTPVDQFLDTQPIALKSRYTYAGVLRAFDAFVHARTPGSWQPSLQVLRAWLDKDLMRSPLANVAHRVCVIARYLDWRASIAGGSHLLAELRAQYGQRLRPIIVALLEDEHEQALLRLRPLPEWGSTLGLAMQDHIARMRSLGYRYDVKTRDLRRFDRFLQRHPELGVASLAQQLEAWRHESPGLRHQWRVQQCGQTLSKAAHRKDPTVPILPKAQGLHGRMVQQQRQPVILSEAQVRRVLDAARNFPSHNAPLRPVALHAMVTLAYCAGLRLGEIFSLTLGDFDLEHGLLEIRETKFFKSRRLPLAPGVMKVMRVYLEARAATDAPIATQDPMWWSPLRRRGYSYGTTEKLLISVMQRAGLKPARGRQGPRVHDLRRTFAAHRMMQWYREGIEPQSRLPYLATYLGHKSIRSTLVYLNITPELLQQASERYRRSGARALRASGGRS